MAQIYDFEGTTHFEFTFADKIHHNEEWYVKFAQGLVFISNRSGDTQIRADFPEEDHWTYAGRFRREDDGDRVYCSFIGAEIKNNHFKLAVSLSTEEGEEPTLDEEAILQFEANGSKMHFVIPGRLGLRLMCFMAGSTRLDEIHCIRKE